MWLDACARGDDTKALALYCLVNATAPDFTNPQPAPKKRPHKKTDVEGVDISKKSGKLVQTGLYPEKKKPKLEVLLWKSVSADDLRRITR